MEEKNVLQQHGESNAPHQKKRRRKRKKTHDETGVSLEASDHAPISEVSEKTKFTAKPNKTIPYNEYAYQRWGFSPLERWCTNMTEKISKDLEKYEVYGRDDEIDEVFISLLREYKNAPILLGEAGVGKTAIVDGFCSRIIKNACPEEFKGCIVWSLELSDIEGESVLDNGDTIRMLGKMKMIVEELAATKALNIIFIDEIHQIVGSGGEKGSLMDVGNTFKPALSRGEISVIGATTQKEYRLSLETDTALQRRFQPIRVNEPNMEQAVYILGKVRDKFERLKQVSIADEIVEKAITLSKRYITDQYLPDKAIDIIDRAVARVVFEKRQEVTETDLAIVINRLKNVPIENIARSSGGQYIDYEYELTKRVKGQEEAVKRSARALARGKQGLSPIDKPQASLMFVGMSGVGKTELAKALAEIEFGSEEYMLRLDMSEYQENDSITRLIGENKIGSMGILTGQVKDSPYRVLLFDEIDKANPKVLDLLLQVLDDGRLSTGLGETISFKDCILIATTNEAAENIAVSIKNKGNFRNLSEEDYNEVVEDTKEALKNKLRAEFLNRWNDIILFNRLEEDVISEIVVMNAEKNREFLFKNHIELLYDDKDKYFDFLTVHGTDEAMGARPLNNLISRMVTDEVAFELQRLGRFNEWYRVVLYIDGEKPGLYNGRYEAKDRRDLRLEFELLYHAPSWNDTGHFFKVTAGEEPLDQETLNTFIKEDGDEPDYFYTRNR